MMVSHGNAHAGIKNILDVLNKIKMRCTYGAASDYLEAEGIEGVSWKTLSALLGKRRVYASWVVSKKTGMPTGYKEWQIHPDLKDSEIIDTSDRLRSIMEMHREKTERLYNIEAALERIEARLAEVKAEVVEMRRDIRCDQSNLNI